MTPVRFAAWLFIAFSVNRGIRLVQRARVEKELHWKGMLYAEGTYHAGAVALVCWLLLSQSN
jgi:hypothetical protein